MTHTFGAYFSPTGGTKRALEAVCGLLGGESESFPLTGPDKKEKTFGPEELLVLALPVYAGQIPAVPGLLDGLKGDNTPCVLLATYGNRHYDNALAQMKRLMEARGFRCVGAAAVVTPHIFAPDPGGGTPGTARTWRSWAAFAQDVKDRLASGAGGQRGAARRPGAARPPRRPGEEGPGLGHLPGLRLLRPGVPPPGPWIPRPCCGIWRSASAVWPVCPGARWGRWAITRRPSPPADGEVLGAPARGGIPVR